MYVVVLSPSVFLSIVVMSIDQVIHFIFITNPLSSTRTKSKLFKNVQAHLILHAGQPCCNGHLLQLKHVSANTRPHQL